MRVAGSSKINLGLLLYVVENQSVVIDDAEVETLYLLQNPANAERLRKGIEQHRQGEYREIDLKAYFSSTQSVEAGIPLLRVGTRNLFC